MICKYCKAVIPDDAKKCQHCGEWIIKPKSKAVYLLFALFTPTAVVGIHELYWGNIGRCFMIPAGIIATLALATMPDLRLICIICAFMTAVIYIASIIEVLASSDR